MGASNATRTALSADSGLPSLSKLQGSRKNGSLFWTQSCTRFAQDPGDLVEKSIEIGCEIGDSDARSFSQACWCESAQSDSHERAPFSIRLSFCMPAIAVLC